MLPNFVTNPVFIVAFSATNCVAAAGAVEQGAQRELGM
jgi:hypothetical protein